jgi:hypothetical protein
VFTRKDGVRRYYLQRGVRKSTSAVELDGHEACTNYVAPLAYLCATVNPDASIAVGFIADRWQRLPNEIIGKRAPAKNLNGSLAG